MSPLRVRDAEKLVSTEPILIREEASIYETVERLIDTRHARCAYVVDLQGRLVGIVTLKALVEHIFAHHYFGDKGQKGSQYEIVHTESALQLAAGQPVYVTPDESLDQAVEKILNRGLEEIPVVDDEGVVTGDINLLDLLSVWMESSLEGRRRTGQEQVRLARYVHPDCICLHLEARTKKAALNEMLSLLERAPQVQHVEAVRRVVEAREVLVTTGVGKGVAIPHGRCEGVRDGVIAIGLSREGVDFASLDGKPVHIIFLMAAPEVAGFPYARILSQVIRLLHCERNQQRLLACETPQELIGVLEEFDREYESKLAPVRH